MMPFLNLLAGIEPVEGELVAGDADGFDDGCADVLKRGVFQQVDQCVADDFGADAAVFGGTGAVGNDSDEVGAAGGPAAAVLTELAAAGCAGPVMQAARTLMLAALVFFIPVSRVFKQVSGVRRRFGYAGNAAARPEKKFGKFQPGKTFGQVERKARQFFQVGAFGADGVNDHFCLFFLRPAAFTGGNFPSHSRSVRRR